MTKGSHTGLMSPHLFVVSVRVPIKGLRVTQPHAAADEAPSGGYHPDAALAALGFHRTHGHGVGAADEAPSGGYHPDATLVALGFTVRTTTA